jgi:hypothetical protein
MLLVLMAKWSILKFRLKYRLKYRNPIGVRQSDFFVLFFWRTLASTVSEQSGFSIANWTLYLLIVSPKDKTRFVKDAAAIPCKINIY